MRMKRLLGFGLCCGLAAALSASAANSVIITEFMASNTQTLADEDGDFSDWIEIQNIWQAPVNLAGYFLTTDPSLVSKWAFPSLTLAPGGYLVVFASGKNRMANPARLHTDFQLDAAGEFLALVAPDGMTLLSAFSPVYPPQLDDVSYGVVPSASTNALVAASAPQILIPSSASGFPSDWASTNYAPGTNWLTGIAPAAIGFDLGATGTNYNPLIRTSLASRMPGVNASAFVRLPFTIPVEEPPQFDWLTLRVKYDDGFIAYLNGTEVARRNAPGTPAWNSAATAPHPEAAAVQFEEIDLTAVKALLQEGVNVLAIQGLNRSASDDDFLLVPELNGRESQVSAPRYFATPTPGTPNAAPFLGAVADTKFSVNRGFYTQPFTVAITSDTPGAQIRYTTNGTAPTEVIGQIYAGPVPVSRTTVVRALATKPGYRSTDVDTQTYIFLSQIVTQSLQTAQSNGYPSSWAGEPADYTMDPRVTSTNGAQVQSALVSLPSIFITTSISNLFDGSTGIYSHPDAYGLAWERPISVEMLDTNGNTEFQINCGLRMEGGAFRSFGYTDKHSFRMLFKTIYGAGKLHYDLFQAPDATTDFDTLVLRAGANDGYAWADAKDTEQFIRDEFGRGLQRATGHPASHSLFAHLYLNGLYWGLYNLVERPNEDFSASYFGGQSADWDSINAGDIKNGDMQAWNNFISLATVQPPTLANYQKMQGNNPDGSRNPAYPIYFDVQDYTDYMIVNMWGGNWDWPNKNFWIGRQRTPDSTGWKFYSWDFENTMGNNLGRSPLNMVSPRSGLENSWVAQPNYYLKGLRDYQLDFGDRVHRFFFNGGLLSPQVLTNRYWSLSEQVRAAILTESARWGDDNLNPPQGLPSWLAERTWIMNTYLPARSDIVLQQFRSAGLYPATAAPVFSQHGGLIVSGFALSMFQSNAIGKIYYTLDGTDPRLVGGVVGLAARAYSNTVALAGGTRVKARVLSGANWSALNEADFVVAELPALRITKLMYHPAPLSPAEITAGFTNADDFEFIELRNTSSDPLNLAGINFDKGITFTFASGTLAAGERLVLAKNAAAFAKRYGTATSPAGLYSGNLANNGERVRLRDATGRTILDFSYADVWYPTTDGFGFALVIRDDTAPGSTWTSAANWRASGAAGGSPGQPDPAPPLFPFVVINELLCRPSAPDKVTVELANLGDASAEVSDWWLTDDFRTPKKFQLPPATVIPAGGFLVLTADDFGPAALGTNALTFSPAGGEVWLFSAAAGQDLTGYCQGWTFGVADQGVSFGRYVISTGSDHFLSQATATLGGRNSSARVGPVVISALMYHPMDFGNTDNTRDEYIELLNITSNAVPLFEPASPTNTWKITGGVDFTLPPNITLAPGERLVLVSLDPVADPSGVANFRRRYNVPDAVRVLGPYSGRLNNDTDTVELKKPTLFESGLTGDVQVEKVSYQDSAPWSPVADGFGPALQRFDPLAYANDPANWIAAAPAPGRAPVAGLPPEITSPLQPRTVAEGATAVLSVGVGGAGPFSYQWLFNGILMDAAPEASLVISNMLLTQTGDYSVYVMSPSGAAFSGPVRVEVLPLPVITQSPTSLNVALGSNFGLSVSAAGTGPLRYQWLFNGTNLPGATLSNYWVTNAQFSHAGPYQALVTDSVGSRTSPSAQVTIFQKPAFVTHPVGQTLAVGETLSLWTEATGSSPLWYRWRKDGTTFLWPGKAQLTIPKAVLTNAGRYDVVVSNLATTVLHVSAILSTSAPVLLVAPPTNQVKMIGSNVTLRALVGLPGTYTNRFLWLFGGKVVGAGTNGNGIAIAASFTNDLVLTNFGPDQAGSYTFLISNAVTVTNLVVTTNPPATNSVVATNVIGAVVAFTALVQPGPDSDGDGMPDAWESLYGLNPYDLSDANQDADGDGLTNLQECLAGTDPRDPTSTLKLVVAGADGSGLAFDFEARSNRTYQVQFRADLGVGGWSNLLSLEARPTNRIVGVTNAVPGITKRYYRVRTP